MVGGGPWTLICMRPILLDSDASCCAAGRSMKNGLSSSLPVVTRSVTLQVTFSAPFLSSISSNGTSLNREASLVPTKHGTLAREEGTNVSVRPGITNGPKYHVEKIWGSF